MQAYFKIWAVLVLMASLIIISCGTDETLVDTDPINPPQPGINIYGTINGLIFNDEDQALEGATISVSDMETMSDENGYFTTTDFFDSEGAHIKVDYPGYHSAHAVLLPLEDQTLTVNITLKKKEGQSGETENKNDITIGEAEVSFEPNSFIDDNGSTYSGAIEFVANYIHPYSEQDQKFEIGELLTQEGTDKRVIQSYGIVSMELNDPDGQELQVSTSATINMEVPAELLAGAPATIPMWYRDEDTGYWIEEGVANLENGKYVGQVAHFTDWMCGSDYEYFYLKGIVTRDGMPYSSGVVVFDMEGYYSPSANLGSKGNYKKLLPNINDFDIAVYDRCAKLVQEELGQPMLTEDREFDFTVTAAPSDISLEVTVFCNSNPDPVNAYVLISIGGSISTVINTNNSTVYTSFSDCSADEITVMAFDPATLTSSETVSLTGPDNQVTLDVCEAVLTGSVTFKIDGEPDYVIPGCTVRIDTLHSPGSDSTFLEWYYFEATDTFEGHPQGFNQQVQYEIAVITRYVPIPGHPDVPNYAPPAGPLVEPEATLNAPFYYEFIEVDYTRVLEDDDHVIFDIQTTKPAWPNAKIRKYQNGIVTELTGTVLVDAFK